MTFRKFQMTPSNVVFVRLKCEELDMITRSRSFGGFEYLPTWKSNTQMQPRLDVEQNSIEATSYFPKI